MLQGYRLLTFTALLSLALTMSARAADWLPVSPEELQMKSEPKAPKASAIFLYRQVDRNDEDYSEFTYSRIKVLTDEGRQYANVEIPYTRGEGTVRAVEARVIRPDGGIVDFNGEIFDKSLVKARGLSMNAKTFTLPNVEVGSIIEYRYRRTLRFGYIYDSRWVLSDDLFTRHAKFTLRPAENFLLRWSWPLGLPADTKPPAKERGLIRLETRDVPAFVSEEFMPPEDVMKYRVEFVYEGQDSDQKEEAAYWKAYGKRSNTHIQRFTKPSRALEEEVARVVQPGDSIEAKARKLYARAQQLRNVSAERQATEQESQREKLAENSDADDVLKNGYGYGTEVTWFFHALLRAAKIDSSVVVISTRNRKFFDPRLMNSGDLNDSVVLVSLGGGDTVYCDPGVKYLPFAFLPWHETAVKGLRLDKDGGQWVTTTLPGRDDTRIERKAVMKLERGSLEGKITVTYHGLEAAWRRYNERNEDATDRRKFLENDLEGDIPTGIDVELTNTPDWTSSEAPLVAEYQVTVPGYAAGAGSRLLMPVGLFSQAEKHMFEHAARVHPVYFSFPYRHADDITIELPTGWQTSTVPKARAVDVNIASYSSGTQATAGKLNIKREITLNTILVRLEHYPQLREFYQSVRAGDEDQIVITPGTNKK
jgi:uncharacterized protein DUF3857